MSIAPPPTPSSSAEAPVRPAREQAVERVAAGVDLADHRVGIDLDAVELEPRGDAGVGEAFGRRRSGRRRPSSTANSVTPSSSSGAPGGARGDDQQVGDMAVGDELLGAGQAEAVARALGLQRDAVAVLGALVDRERGDGLARDDAGEPARRRARVPFSASTAATAVVRKGEGDRLRPISSSTTPASTWPRPSPPWSSPIRMPVKPISANCFHRSRRKPVGVVRRRAARACARRARARRRNRVAVSRSIGLVVVEVEGHFDPPYLRRRPGALGSERARRDSGLPPSPEHGDQAPAVPGSAWR